MAVTKLLHIKAAGSGSPGRPLLNAICYVMNPEKTEGGISGGTTGVSFCVELEAGRNRSANSVSDDRSVL